MKRRQVLLGAAAIPAAAFLSACGGNGTSTTGSSPAGASGGASSGSLEFITWQMEEAGYKEWWQAVMDKFAEENAGWEVAWQHMDSSDVPSHLINRIAAGDSSQIFHLPTESFASFAADGLLYPLDEKFAGTDVLENWTSSQSLMNWDGKTQGIMIVGYPVELCYNEKLLADAGVSVPATGDELLQAAEELTGGDIYGFGTITKQHRDLFRQCSSHVYGYGGRWEADGAYTFTDPKTVAGIENFRAASKFSPQGVDSGQKRELFKQGKIAMMLDGPFMIPQFKELDPSIGDSIKIARAPFEYVSYYAGNGLHIPESIPEEQKEKVWNFIEIATRADMQDLFVELTKTPAARNGAGAGVETDPLLDPFLADAAESVSILPEAPGIRAEFGEFSRIVMDGLIEMQTSDKPTEDILQSIEDNLASANIKPE